MASENLDLIDAALAGEVVGTYAKTKIYPGQLLNTYMLGGPARSRRATPWSVCCSRPA